MLVPQYRRMIELHLFVFGCQKNRRAIELGLVNLSAKIWRAIGLDLEVFGAKYSRVIELDLVVFGAAVWGND